MNYAIVDIETTGLYHQDHGITEIAVVHFDGENTELAFHSLINPGRSIPGHISHLTGLRNANVEDAPYFNEILEPLARALKDRIFVAHNVNFDYNFLKAAFKSAGIPFNFQRVCTMRMARKLLPELRSHRLETLTSALKINNSENHRASGDALATADLFRKLIEMDTEGVLDELLKKNNRSAILPPGVSVESVEKLPMSPGVYYFYSDRTHPIYIGKAKNLKRRVLSHFTASSSTGIKQIFQREVKRIDFKPTENEYEALLLEDAEIKRWWPKHNRAQKERVSGYAVVPYETRVRESRFGIIKTRERSDALAWFNSYHTAKVWLYRELIQFEIDPKFAGFYSPDEFESEGMETRIEEFIAMQRVAASQSFVLLSSAGKKDRFGVAILNGKYKGFGHFNGSEDSIEKIESKLHAAPDSMIAKVIIGRMLIDEKFEKHAL